MQSFVVLACNEEEVKSFSDFYFTSCEPLGGDFRVGFSRIQIDQKIPRGVIEDVLVQVDNFYYPRDFIVLDTDPL
ncbi:hypothetical protein AAG906_013752 [Vitis piasezkii]